MRKAQQITVRGLLVLGHLDRHGASFRYRIMHGLDMAGSTVGTTTSNLRMSGLIERTKKPSGYLYSITSDGMAFLDSVRAKIAQEK